MSDTRQRPDGPVADQAAAAAGPIITPPPGAYGATGAATVPGADTAPGPQPGTHPVGANLGSALAEEHGAPAPTARIGTKLWIIAGLVALIAVIAIASVT